MYRWPLSEWEDGFGDALVGLVLAMRDYEEGHGASFETYAGKRIRGVMLDGVRKRNGRRSRDGFVPNPKMVPIQDPDFDKDRGFIHQLDPPDPQASEAFLELENQDLSRLVIRLVEKLPERDRLIMTLYFFEGMPLREIGELYNLTESRVSQIVSTACKRILRLVDQ